MYCERCSNDDARYFFQHQDVWVCRKCITFQGGLSERVSLSFNEHRDTEYTLDFKLSTDQTKLSNRLYDLIQANKDVLIYAACGAGKTEIVLKTISECLESGLKVGIAIPRRQVVLELASRLKEYFTGLNVIPVCEGYTETIFADLIVCTTHQLFNYEDYFDVLILDEPDAFPFANNPLLQSIQKRSVKGNTIYLSATPDSSMLKLETLTLFKRFHGYDLLVPDVIISNVIGLYLKLYSFTRLHSKVLVFVPTIKLAQRLSMIFNIPCIHSKIKDKETIIDDFSGGKFNVLLTTTIMERGITIEGVNVCVLYADHSVFNEASLIQIAGRVGRRATSPTGHGLFLCLSKSKKVDKCLETLNMMNA